jgi:hypothetical protein
MSWAFEDDDEVTTAYADDGDFTAELEALGLMDPNDVVVGSGFSVAKRSNSSANLEGGTSVNEAQSQKNLKNLMQPLPLMHFQADPDNHTTHHVFQTEELATVENSFDDSPDTRDLRKLHDPHRSLLIQQYFNVLSAKESYLRENVSKAIRDDKQIIDDVVYRNGLTGGAPDSRVSSRPSSEGCDSGAKATSKSSAASKTKSESRPVLSFSGEFESGNIDTASFVTGRNKLHEPTVKALKKSKKDIHTFAIPKSVDLEYDITCRNDLSTTGNIQWYYFRVEAPKYYGNESIGDRELVKYPLRVRFQITNMEKKDSLYNYGMRPVRCSENDTKSGWINTGEDVCYFKNGRVLGKKSRAKSGEKGTDGRSKMTRIMCPQYSTVFTYTFTEPDKVYFAHTFPYTYSDLQRYLVFLEQDRRIALVMRRKLLCTTLAGNRCDLLTITGPCSSIEESNARPSIVLSARVHPGEAMASYMMHGMIDFLTSEAPEAQQLRQRYIFKIIPMLNPDGVIHGNYRCSLAGADLNRKYQSKAITCYPTIIAIKNLLYRTHKSRGVALYLDLHGHSKKKNAFIYGCDYNRQPEKWKAETVLSKDEANSQRVYTRLFPYMLSRMSDIDKKYSHFSFPDCCFGVSKSKAGTGRVVAWRDIAIPAAYTIEMSFCGPGNNKEISMLRKATKILGRQAYAESRDNGVNTQTSSKATSTKLSTTTTNTSGSGSGDEGDDDDSLGEDCESPTDVEDTVTATKGSKKSGSMHSSSAALSEEADAIRALLDTYPEIRAYGKDDLTDIGRQTALAIFYFSNLDVAEGVPIPNLDGTLFDTAVTESKQSSSDGVVCAPNLLANDGDSRPSSRATPRLDGGCAESAESGPCDVIELRGEDTLNEPMLIPSVFSKKAILLALANSTSVTVVPAIVDGNQTAKTVPVSAGIPLNFRMKSELAVRNMLKIPLDTSLTDNPHLVNLDVDDFEEQSDDDGSDSAPSENDVSEKQMLKSLGKKKLRSKKDSLLYLRKAIKQLSDDVVENESEDEKSSATPTPRTTTKPSSMAVKLSKPPLVRRRSKDKDVAATVHRSRYRLDESDSNTYDPLSQLALAQKTSCKTLDLSLGLPDGALVPSMGTKKKKSALVENNKSAKLEADLSRRKSFDAVNMLTTLDSQYSNAIAAAQAAAASLPGGPLGSTMTSSAAIATKYAQSSRETDRALSSKTSSGRMLRERTAGVKDGFSR